MSEQSGPITREQVERAIAKPRNIDYRELPRGWREWAPDYVIAAEAADDWDAEHAALTRWRDELAAAEPVRRVARWDARRGAYVALDGHGTVCMITLDRADCIAWGYEIEGGPEPVSKPHMMPAFRKAIVEMRTGGASLSEVADAYSLGIGEVSDALDAESMEPERPAPRFKVGDRVTSGLGGPWKIGRVEWGRLVPEADCDEWVYHHASGNVSACESVLALAWTPTPASPPAPEVVDVPQPLVKRFGGVEASWGPGRLDVITLEEINGDDEPFDVPIALLRAMLAAIDAQQGGAS